MVVRMLAPAGPIGHARPALIRASIRLPPTDRVRTVWDWDDGAVEDAEHPWTPLVSATRRHRYDRPGVYLVSLRAEGDDALSTGRRYVAVRSRGQVAASGWIRGATGLPAAFGFVITPAGNGTEGRVALRCALPSGELVGRSLAWLIAGDPAALHFGGDARVGSTSGQLSYRVDAALTLATREAPRLTISVYARDSAPGHDAPLERVSGPIRPGRVDMIRFANPP
jgi:hypothetical protein